MAAPDLVVYKQGQTNISADRLNTFEQTCDTVSELRGIIGTQGLQIYSRGNMSATDGLGGPYMWSPSATGPDNGRTVIVPTGAVSGAWILLQNIDVAKYVTLEMFGGAGDGITLNDSALIYALNTGLPLIINTTAQGYLFAGGNTFSGQVQIFGFGSKSTLLCDTTILTVTNGDNSILSNFDMKNVTAPWTIQRYVPGQSSWAATFLTGSTCLATLAQSSADGRYQPTVNDTDIWSSLTAPQQNQNVGPLIEITGSFVTVEKITGRFVSIWLNSPQNCIVRNCDFKAGKNFAGGILFWNASTRGSGNEAYLNKVRDASFSGIVFLANDGPKAKQNTIYGAGESGIKTWQGTAITGKDWCTQLESAVNSVEGVYYDGLNYLSTASFAGNLLTFGSSKDDVALNCYGDGMNVDGLRWSISGTKTTNSGRNGITTAVSYSSVCDVMSIDDNLNNAVSGINGFVIVVGSGNPGKNLLSGIRAYRTASRNGFVGYFDSSNTQMTISDSDFTDSVASPTQYVPYSGLIYDIANVLTNGANTSPPVSLPDANAFLNTPSAISAVTPTLIPFDTLNFDSGGYFNLSTHKYTPLVAGKYQVTVVVTVAATTGSTDYLKSIIALNGTEAVSVINSCVTGTGVLTSANSTAIVTCNGSTDYITGLAYCTQAGTVETHTFINILRIGN